MTTNPPDLPLGQCGTLDSTMLTSPSPAARPLGEEVLPPPLSTIASVQVDRSRSTFPLYLGGNYEMSPVGGSRPMPGIVLCDLFVGGARVEHAPGHSADQPICSSGCDHATCSPESPQPGWRHRHLQRFELGCLDPPLQSVLRVNGFFSAPAGTGNTRAACR